MDPITLGIAAAGAYLLLKSQKAAPSAPAPAQATTNAQGIVAENWARDMLQRGADQAALVSPGGVPYLTASAETAMANDKAGCEAANGYWVPTDVFGLSKTKGVCVDPQKSSVGCQGTGGTWTGAECAYPGTELMGLDGWTPGPYGDAAPSVWTPGLVVAAGALAFAWYASRH